MCVLPRGARLHGVSFGRGRGIPIQSPWAWVQRGANARQEPISLHSVSWHGDTRRPVSSRVKLLPDELPDDIDEDGWQPLGMAEYRVGTRTEDAGKVDRRLTIYCQAEW